MQTLKATLTAAALAVLVTLAAAGALNASERRAEYLDAESEYYSCIESGLDRIECAAGVGL